MLLPRRLWAIALSATSVAAFKDTSPFFLFSTTPITSSQLASSNIARADAVHSSLSEVLRSCEWDSYILVSQPSVSVQDFAGRSSAPHMRRWFSGEEASIKATMDISEVVGEIDMGKLARQLELGCHASVEDVDASTGYVPIGDDSKRVMKISFPPLPTAVEERASKLLEHDSFLNALLSGFSEQKYVVLYTTTPPTGQVTHSTHHHEPHLYENDDPFPGALHVDLKRDLSARQVTASNASLPLFETYQYFTPALFTGIMVSIALFLILYVGVSALASLQVSYFAFSKEMGPAAQKKQQ